jgi:hypothetical protein
MNNLAMPALLMMASPDGLPAAKELTGLFTGAAHLLGPIHNL